jgi:hypothetical protein
MATAKWLLLRLVRGVAGVSTLSPAFDRPGMQELLRRAVTPPADGAGLIPLCKTLVLAYRSAGVIAGALHPRDRNARGPEDAENPK